MAKLGEEKGFKVYMMTPDKDCGQLVTAVPFYTNPNMAALNLM
jgi:5'-3' exonuclease